MHFFSFLAAGFCPKNLAFARKIMVLPAEGGCSPLARIRLWINMNIYDYIFVGNDMAVGIDVGSASQSSTVGRWRRWLIMTGGDWRWCVVTQTIRRCLLTTLIHARSAMDTMAYTHRPVTLNWKSGTLSMSCTTVQYWQWRAFSGGAWPPPRSPAVQNVK